jgi:nucleoside-diphosphate-sugar epimerase
LVVNLLAAKAKVDGIITVHGGNQWRPFVHVDDAAKAVFMALKAPLELVAGEIFNVGSEGQNKTITQIGEMIRDHVVGAKLVASDTITDRRNYRVRFSHIHNTLGFEPSWTLDQGIRQVVEAVANGTISNYNDPQYSNVKYLSQAGAIEVIRSSDEEWGLELLEQPQGAGLVGSKS